VVADVAIVGAGPAGAALAIELGRRGVRVNVYEKARAPRLKACGEGILPHGVAALEAVAGSVPDAPRVRGLRFVIDGMAVAADFPEGRGLVVRRDRLHAWLLDCAASTAGVDLRMGTAYAPGGERFVVGADGLRSIFHRRLAARRPAVRRVGLSTHVGGIEGVRDQVEVFFHPLGEVYIAPVGGGEALVAALLYQRTFRRDALTYLLREIPELRARTTHIEMTTPLLAAAPLGLHVPRVTDRNLLLIGDAAGAPDPITGDGIAMAFASVQPAADGIVDGDLARYARVRLEMGRTSDRLGRLLLRLTRVDGRAARVLLGRPSLVPTLLDVAIARRPLSAATLLRAVL
jgi:flavin-dependent dehydrogenase